MKNKIIFYLCGGGMSGVFGAGVLTQLKQMNFYENIETIYGSSAGAINASYFLTKQAKLGSSIYYEDLIHNFVQKNIFLIIIKCLFNIKKDKLRNKETENYINLNYLFDIIKNKKRLDLNKLNKSKIKFYAEVLNVKTNKIEYLNVKGKNTLKILRASSNAFPYYLSYENVNNKKYIDAGIEDAFGVQYLIKKYPKKKIVIIANESLEKYSNKIIYFFSKFILRILYGKKFERLYIHRERFIKKDLELMKNNKNILLICPPKDNPTKIWTTDKKKLLKTYEFGKKEAKKIKEFIYPI